MEKNVLLLNRDGITVDLLTGIGADGKEHYGVRLHPYSKDLPNDVMILCAGDTFAEALTCALEKATHGHWEDLVWAARPWEVKKPAWATAQDRWGLR